MKVLMLGWEFPPLFSGGLGVATYGMVKALRHRADIKLIIPSYSLSSSLPNVNIIGLNSLTAHELDVEQLRFSLEDLAEVHRLPQSVSPYHFINEEIEKSRQREESVNFTSDRAMEMINKIFSDSNVYGYNVMHKVYLYTQLADQIATNLEFDIIHAHDWITFAAGVRIKRNTGKPLVLHVHSLETDRAGEGTRNAIYYLEEEALQLAERVLSVSQFTKEQIVKHYHVDPSKIYVVHNGIDPDERPRKPHQLRDKLVVFLGRLTHQKGPEFLLETAEKVTKVYPRVKFVVAGTGDQFAHILETSAYKKLGSKFIFAGFLSKAKVDELLSMADVYFMPSVSEPFGITALEAAQHNVPSVLSSQSGAAEVMKASLKADFWDTDKYANYIYALLNYSTLNQQLSESAKAELEGLTWDHAAEKIFNVYQQLLTI
jgi:glycosyltransferase involved in cell wall biosynthesis